MTPFRADIAEHVFKAWDKNKQTKALSSWEQEMMMMCLPFAISGLMAPDVQAINECLAFLGLPGQVEESSAQHQETLFIWLDLMTSLRKFDFSEKTDSTMLEEKISAVAKRLMGEFPLKSGQQAGWNFIKFHDLQNHLLESIFEFGAPYETATQATEHCHVRKTKWPLRSSTNRRDIGKQLMRHECERLAHIVVSANQAAQQRNSEESSDGASSGESEPDSLAEREDGHVENSVAQPFHMPVWVAAQTRQNMKVRQVRLGRHVTLDGNGIHHFAVEGPLEAHLCKVFEREYQGCLDNLKDMMPSLKAWPHKSIPLEHPAFPPKGVMYLRPQHCIMYHEADNSDSEELSIDNTDHWNQKVLFGRILAIFSIFSFSISRLEQPHGNSGVHVVRSQQTRHDLVLLRPFDHYPVQDVPSRYGCRRLFESGIFRVVSTASILGRAFLLPDFGCPVALPPHQGSENIPGVIPGQSKLYHVNIFAMKWGIQYLRNNSRRKRARKEREVDQQGVPL